MLGNFTKIIKKRLFTVTGILILNMFPFSGYAQILPDSRIIDWSNAGIPGGIPDYPVQHSVLDFGAVGDGKTDDHDAFQEAIDKTTPGKALLVPEGTYYLSSGISINNGIVLRGEGMDKTIIESDDDGSLNFLNFRGGEISDFVDIIAGATKGSRTITVNDVSSFTVGDYVLMRTDHITGGENAPEEWPRQHAEIESINGNTLTLNQVVYMDSPYSWTHIAKINLLTGAGIENMHVKGMTGNNFLTKIKFYHCAYSWVRGCEVSGTSPDRSYMYVIDMDESYRGEVRENYVHNSRVEADLGWAMGYGIRALKSTDMLFINNVLDFIRPGLCLACGSGGCVIAYNFVWETLKYGEYDGGGSIDAHNNNSPYHGLIEGNCVNRSRFQSIPPMTILRNKIFGGPGCIYFDLCKGHNLIGNQLDRSRWGINTIYLIGGVEDLIEHGNYTVHNGIGMEWDPSIRDHNIPDSYFFSEKPEWFGDLAWPPFGGDLMVAGGGFNPNRIPAEVWYWTKRFPEEIPTDLSASAIDATTQELNWTGNSVTRTTPEGTVDSIDFIIARSTDGTNFDRIATTKRTTYTDTGLTPGQKYWYYVRARNHVTVEIKGGEIMWSGPGGESDPSNVIATEGGILSVKQGNTPQNTLSVFPNPTSEVLNFDLPDNQAQSISIYSGSGKLVKEEKYKGNSVSISGLEKGMYFLVVKGLWKSNHAKFIIE